MRFLLALSLASIASLTACSNSTSVGDNAFQGLWTCSKVDSLTFTTPPNSAPQSNTVSSGLDIVASVTGALSATVTLDGGTGCTFSLTSSGSTATLQAGQCASSGLTLAYSQGSATVSGSSLTASLSYTFSGSIPVAGDGGMSTEAVAGSGTTAFTCTK